MGQNPPQRVAFSMGGFGVSETVFKRGTAAENRMFSPPRKKFETFFKKPLTRFAPSARISATARTTPRAQHRSTRSGAMNFHFLSFHPAAQRAFSRVASWRAASTRACLAVTLVAPTASSFHRSVVFAASITPRRAFLVWRLSFVGALSLLSVTAANAQDLDDLQPVVPRIGVGAIDAAKPGETGAAFRAVNPMTGLVIEQIISGTMSADEAWEKGALTKDDLLRLLSQPRLSDGTRSDEVRRDLAGVLSQRAPETVKEPQKLDAFVRLALCHYWSSVGDARAVPLCEGLVREKLSDQTKDATPWPWLWSLTYLAQYYEKTGHWEKAAKTWLRSEKPLAEYAHDARSAAGVLIDAARALKKVDKEKEGDELYNRVPQYGDGFMNGVALYDQAYMLIKQGKDGEARELLKQPLKGAGADQAKVGLLSLLAASYLRTGEVEAAQRAAQEAMIAYATVDEPLSHSGLAPQAERAKRVQDWCESYQAKHRKTATPKVHAAAS